MEDFKINFEDPQQKEAYVNYVRGITKGEYIICHNNVLQQRSQDLNEYYFGVVLPYISRYSGHTTEELHDIFKNSLLKTITFRNDSDLTTTDCSSEQMWNYVYRVRRWFYKFTGRWIPDPKEVVRIPELTWGANDRFY